jgi:hypothetical protein
MSAPHAGRSWRVESALQLGDRVTAPAAGRQERGADRNPDAVNEVAPADGAVQTETPVTRLHRCLP